jgi:hypothetical protein
MKGRSSTMVSGPGEKLHHADENARLWRPLPDPGPQETLPSPRACDQHNQVVTCALPGVVLQTSGDMLTSKHCTADQGATCSLPSVVLQTKG